MDDFKFFFMKAGVIKEKAEVNVLYKKFDVYNSSSTRTPVDVPVRKMAKSKSHAAIMIEKIAKGNKTFRLDWNNPYQHL